MMPPGKRCQRGHIRWRTPSREYVWLLPVLPLLGFVLNGALVAGQRAQLGPGRSVAPTGPRRMVPRTIERTRRGHRTTITTPRRAIGTPAITQPDRAGRAGAVLRCWPSRSSLAMRAGRSMASRSSRRYFRWMPVSDLKIDVAFQLDQLSMVMVLVITGVGTLIHIFSVGYMRDDPGYPRYFAYLNLFVFFMLAAGARRATTR